ncbi:hypothetical protein B0H14DRAFT_2623501 [Mycena olivaceomarginata]|nr:hypothetical protein B0H14DRAFT_2623501 [Mycena olivaceomarginata]
MDDRLGILADLPFSARSSLRPTRPPLTDHPSDDDQILTLHPQRGRYPRLGQHTRCAAEASPAPGTRAAAAPMSLGKSRPLRDSSHHDLHVEDTSSSPSSRRLIHAAITTPCNSALSGRRARMQTTLASTRHHTARLSQLCCDLRARGTDPHRTTMSISGSCRRLQDVFAVFAARRSVTMTSHACCTYIHFLIAFSHTGHDEPLRVWVLALVPSPSRLNIVFLIDFPRTVDTDALGNCTRNTARDTDKDWIRTLGSTAVGGAESIALWEMETASRIVRGFSSRHCLRGTPPQPAPAHTGPQLEIGLIAAGVTPCAGSGRWVPGTSRPSQRRASWVSEGEVGGDEDSEVGLAGHALSNRIAPGTGTRILPFASRATLLPSPGSSSTLPPLVRFPLPRRLRTSQLPIIRATLPLPQSSVSRLPRPAVLLFDPSLNGDLGLRDRSDISPPSALAPPRFLAVGPVSLSPQPLTHPFLSLGRSVLALQRFQPRIWWRCYRQIPFSDIGFWKCVCEQRGQCEDAQSRVGPRTYMLLELSNTLSSLGPESRLLVVDLRLADQLPPLRRWDVLGLHLGGVTEVIGSG